MQLEGMTCQMILLGDGSKQFEVLSCETLSPHKSSCPMCLNKAHLVFITPNSLCEEDCSCCRFVTEPVSLDMKLMDC